MIRNTGERNASFHSEEEEQSFLKVVFIRIGKLNILHIMTILVTRTAIEASNIDYFIN
jgi:hypothetical protein